MCDTIHDLIDELWPLLPPLTIGLRFRTALVDLTAGTTTAVRVALLGPGPARGREAGEVLVLRKAAA